MKKVEMKQKAEIVYFWFPCDDDSAVIYVLKASKGIDYSTMTMPPTPAINIYRLKGGRISNKDHLTDVMSAIRCIEEWGLMAVSWDNPSMTIHEDKKDTNFPTLSKLIGYSSIRNAMLHIIAEDPERGNEWPLARFVWLDNGDIFTGEKEFDDACKNEHN